MPAALARLFVLAVVCLIAPLGCQPSEPGRVCASAFKIDRGDVWKQTTVSQEWLADRLKMRSVANVSQLLRRAEVYRGKVPKVPRRLGLFVTGVLRGAG